MEWNGIFGMKRRIDNQHFVKSAVLQYSNWNGMEWNTGGKNQKLHIPFWNGMEWNIWEEEVQQPSVPI